MSTKSPILNEWSYTIGNKVFIQKELTLFQLFTILNKLPQLNIDQEVLMTILDQPKRNFGAWFAILGVKVFDLLQLLISPADQDIDNRSFRQKLADPKSVDYPEMEHITPAQAVLILDRFFLQLDRLQKMPEFQSLKKPILEYSKPIWLPFSQWLKSQTPPDGVGQSSDSSLKN
jgi:hypothetical protein